MIYDCFLYNGEADLLKIRIEEMRQMLQPVTFVVVESEYTFTGIRKPNYSRPTFDSDVRIEWFLVNPKKDGPWINERDQRNAIKFILHTFKPSDSDTIIISDVDEIPRSYAIQHYRKEFGLVALQMDMYYYYLNCLSARNEWILPRIMSWEYLKDKEPDDVRRSGFNLCLFQAGWHYCWQGGVDTMLTKFKSFSHQEPEVQALADPKVLRGKLDKLESLWGIEKFKIVNNQEMPYYVQTHTDEFKHMIYDSSLRS